MQSWHSLCCLYLLAWASSPGLSLRTQIPEGELALALLVARVLADHHDPAVTADHFALVADLLDARLDLHGVPLRVLQLICWSGLGTIALPPSNLLVAVDDTTTCEVVWAQLHHYPVLGEDSNVVLSHLPRDVCENDVLIGELNTKHRIGQRLSHNALDLNDPVLLGHILR